MLAWTGFPPTMPGQQFLYGDLKELVDVLEARWAAREALAATGTICPWVFFRRDGRRVKGYQRAWKTATAAAGCPGRLPHDFRRTAVRNLNRAGVTDTVAMKVTGHKTRSVFDRYDITSEADLVEASRKLRDSLAGTISGTIGHSDAASLRERLAK